MEILIFMVTGLGVFALSDVALDRIEGALGHALPYRSVVFFVLMLGFGSLAFWLVRVFVLRSPS